MVIYSAYFLFTSSFCIRMFPQKRNSADYLSTAVIFYSFQPTMWALKWRTQKSISNDFDEHKLLSRIMSGVSSDVCKQMSEKTEFFAWMKPDQNDPKNDVKNRSQKKINRHSALADLPSPDLPGFRNMERVFIFLFHWLKIIYFWPRQMATPFGRSLPLSLIDNSPAFVPTKTICVVNSTIYRNLSQFAPLSVETEFPSNRNWYRVNYSRLWCRSGGPVGRVISFLSFLFKMATDPRYYRSWRSGRCCEHWD